MLIRIREIQAKTINDNMVVGIESYFSEVYLVGEKHKRRTCAENRYTK